MGKNIPRSVLSGGTFQFLAFLGVMFVVMDNKYMSHCKMYRNGLKTLVILKFYSYNKFNMIKCPMSRGYDCLEIFSIQEK